MKYDPPFTITPGMLKLASSISEKVGKLDLYHDFDAKPHLRKSNRIRSVHSSLAIEANSLSLKEVRDVINGKTVLGPEKEIIEVKDAFRAYAELSALDPYSVDDLKRIHGIMMSSTLKEAGTFRNSEEGVFDGERVIFVAPPPERVGDLINDLLGWINDKRDDLDALILSSIFHYEFVFIHPFSDGNGRMARLWQTALLTEWRSIFQYMPIESEIEKDQEGYYKAIAESNESGSSNSFIEYMLSRIDKALDDIIRQASAKEGMISEYVRKLLEIMEFDVPYTTHEMMRKLRLKSKETFRKNYLHPAMEYGLVVMTEPDKPRSKNQRYIKK